MYTARMIDPRTLLNALRGEQPSVIDTELRHLERHLAQALPTAHVDIRNTSRPGLTPTATVTFRLTGAFGTLRATYSLTRPGTCWLAGSVPLHTPDGWRRLAHSAETHFTQALTTTRTLH